MVCLHVTSPYASYNVTVLRPSLLAISDRTSDSFSPNAILFLHSAVRGLGLPLASVPYHDLQGALSHSIVALDICFIALMYISYNI